MNECVRAEMKIAALEAEVERLERPSAKYRFAAAAWEAAAVLLRSGTPTSMAERIAMENARELKRMADDMVKWLETPSEAKK